MKAGLRKIFFPLLSRLESGDQAFVYKPSHRKILLAVGVLFSALGSTVAFIALNQQSSGHLFPALVFLLVGMFSIIVAALGTDRAVATIWGSR